MDKTKKRELAKGNEKWKMKNEEWKMPKANSQQPIANSIINAKPQTLNAENAKRRERQTHNPKLY